MYNEKNLAHKQNQIDLNWLRLARSQNVGAKTFWDLMSIYNSPKAALNALPELASKVGGKIRIVSEQSINAEIEATEEFGAQIICANNPNYPYLLKNIADAPPVIVVKGNASLLSAAKKVAIVGARNASTNGCNFANRIACDLVKHEYVTVSGLAKGIDTAAHKGSLQFGTIGVIASGIDQVYPAENKNLYEEMFVKGLVVTEFPFASPPTAKHFPQRNRIISGLSLGIIIIEAALKSGTLITARFAIEQNREIFAVPGSPSDPRCQGTNSLIKQGAYLLESVEDVLRVLEGSALSLSEKSIYNFTKQVELDEKEIDYWRPKVIEKLSYTPTSLDEVQKQLKLPTMILSRIIVELELAGKLERGYGNKVNLLDRI